MENNKEKTETEILNEKEYKARYRKAVHAREMKFHKNRKKRKSNKTKK